MVRTIENGVTQTLSTSDTPVFNGLELTSDLEIQNDLQNNVILTSIGYGKGNGEGQCGLCGFGGTLRNSVHGHRW